MKIIIKIYNAIVDIAFIAVLIIGAWVILPHILNIDIGRAVGQSMEPTIHNGDITYINTKDTDLEVGDIAQLQDKVTGMYIIHRVYQITDEGYIFKGDNNDEDDGEIVTQEQIKGTYLFKIPAWLYWQEWCTVERIYIAASILSVMIIIKHIIYLNQQKKQNQQQS